MDTDAVRLFVLTADTLNISAAGRALGIAPAVASARLSKLEKRLGADLLHRSTRQVSLSPEGRTFLTFARELLAQEEAALEALGHGSAEITGTLRLTASSTFEQRHIVPLLAEFLDRHPRVNLELRLSDARTSLIEEGVDLAVRSAPIRDSGLRVRKLADGRRRILCASPAYLARHGVPCEPADLARHRTLGFGDGAARTLWSRGGEPDGAFPPLGAVPRVVCDDGASMRIATRAGVGISMNSLWSVHAELADGSLVRVLPEHEIDDSSAIWLV